MQELMEIRDNLVAHLTMVTDTGRIFPETHAFLVELKNDLDRICRYYEELEEYQEKDGRELKDEEIV